MCPMDTLCIYYVQARALQRQWIVIVFANICIDFELKRFHAAIPSRGEDLES